MQRSVNRAEGDNDTHEMDDDPYLTALIQEGEDRLEYEQHARERRHATNTRWRLFMMAVMFLSQVFVELGRRCLQCLQRHLPRCISFRWLVWMCSCKRIGTLRLLLTLGLAFVLPCIVLTIGRLHFSSGRGAKTR
ncbi:unnamed protein product [Peronospora belbahrii]|uniref:Transmembrane protein n=1 Tax=Peronospora belbahrii TaxID=622444 RepID=A0ABN8CZK1_9STRA|nr:unnamed protein product [Peronospora belbahrii]